MASEQKVYTEADVAMVSPLGVEICVSCGDV
jgi:hypothetical protein